MSGQGGQQESGHWWSENKLLSWLLQRLLQCHRPKRCAHHQAWEPKQLENEFHWVLKYKPKSFWRKGAPNKNFLTCSLFGKLAELGNLLFMWCQLKWITCVLQDSPSWWFIHTPDNSVHAATSARTVDEGDLGFHVGLSKVCLDSPWNWWVGSENCAPRDQAEPYSFLWPSLRCHTTRP